MFKNNAGISGYAKPPFLGKDSRVAGLHELHPMHVVL